MFNDFLFFKTADIQQFKKNLNYLSDKLGKSENIFLI